MLKIIELLDNKNGVAMTFRGTEPSDFLLAQKIFRHTISATQCVESSFGFNENFEEIPVFRYPKSRTISLVYNKEFGRYAATWPKGKQHSIE